jgi:hypothetical protein
VGGGGVEELLPQPIIQTLSMLRLHAKAKRIGNRFRDIIVFVLLVLLETSAFGVLARFAMTLSGMEAISAGPAGAKKRMDEAEKRVPIARNDNDTNGIHGTTQRASVFCDFSRNRKIEPRSAFRFARLESRDTLQVTACTTARRKKTASVREAVLKSALASWPVALLDWLGLALLNRLVDERLHFP